MECEHLNKQYDADLKYIREELLVLGRKVELMLANAMKSLVERDISLAERTISFDHEIDQLEEEIYEKCLQVFATSKATSRDLRFLVLSLKIAADLERIGDQCATIAVRARELNAEPPLKISSDLPRMANWATVMIKEALDAFVRGDDELAHKVCKDDQFVHDLNEQIQRVLLTFMMEDDVTVIRASKINYIAKCLERIADYATNVAEMVVSMINAKVTGHMIPFSAG
jgi:phosphate transport system protein